VTATTTGVVTNIQNVFGSTGNNYLMGSAASNVMDGGAGDDTMSGQGGNDIMVGNYSSDNMNGGAGVSVADWWICATFIRRITQEGLESIMSSWNNVTDGTFNISNTIGTASSTQPRLVGDTNIAGVPAPNGVQ
jgi:Ca2+-binding RTX toxin-like protein